jgi:hypothetical protein
VSLSKSISEKLLPLAFITIETLRKSIPIAEHFSKLTGWPYSPVALFNMQFLKCDEPIYDRENTTTPLNKKNNKKSKSVVTEDDDMVEDEKKSAKTTPKKKSRL